MQTHPAVAPNLLSSIRTVLVVDDEPALRLSLKTIIEQRFKVVTCADGQQAINFASEHTAEVYAAFVDYGMWPMDGSLVCSALRSLDATISLIGSSGNEDAPFQGPLFAKLLKKHLCPEQVMTLATSAVRSSERLRHPRAGRPNSAPL
jgi:CheY-like chemotaxis protein